MTGACHPHSRSWIPGKLTTSLSVVEAARAVCPCASQFAMSKNCIHCQVVLPLAPSRASDHLLTRMHHLCSYFGKGTISYYPVHTEDRGLQWWRRFYLI